MRLYIAMRCGEFVLQSIALHLQKQTAKRRIARLRRAIMMSKRFKPNEEKKNQREQPNGYSLWFELIVQKYNFYIYNMTLKPICVASFLYAVISPLCFSTIAFSIERPTP